MATKSQRQAAVRDTLVSIIQNDLHRSISASLITSTTQMIDNFFIHSTSPTYPKVYIAHLTRKNYDDFNTAVAAGTVHAYGVTPAVPANVGGPLLPVASQSNLLPPEGQPTGEGDEGEGEEEEEIQAGEDEGGDEEKEKGEGSKWDEEEGDYEELKELRLQLEEAIDTGVEWRRLYEESEQKLEKVTEEVIFFEK